MDWTMFYKGIGAGLWLIGFCATVGAGILVYALLDAIFTLIADAAKRKRGGKK